MVSRQVTGFDAETTRRTLLRMGAGGILAVGLAACGGGGGGGDSTAEKQQALRDAFANLQDGMIWTDVEALVGFPANDIRYETELRWLVDGMVLDIRFTSNTPFVIGSAFLKEKGAPGGKDRRFRV